MPPIPPFSPQGVIPPFLGSDETTHLRSPYMATMEELLTSLGGTPARRALVKGLLRYRLHLYGLGYTQGLQLVDGSFVEAIEITGNRDPRDIDVMSYLQKPAKYANAELWQGQGIEEWTSEVADNELNKTRFSVDSYAIATDESYGQTVLATMYWYSLFSHQRTTQRWKGFVMIPLDPSADGPVLESLA